jgi:DNA invertase Pin-like site-specific DNA recombinase
MSALAEMERGIIAARQKDVHKDRRDRGIVWGVDMGPKNKTPLDIKERIMLQRNSGRAYGKIAEELNADGIPTQNGRKWYASTVKNIVDANIETGDESGDPEQD